MQHDVGVDWFQATTDASRSDAVFEACMVAAGGEAPKVSTGRRVPGGAAYERGYYWPSGMEFHAGGRDRTWLRVPGAACSAMEFGDVQGLAVASLFGGTCTRLDVRRDLRGDGITLVRDLHGACEALQLRGVRQFTPYPIKSADGQVEGYGVLLGSYASPKFVRCYDKGLETGTLGEGKWVRFEAELTGSEAHQAALRVFAQPSLDESVVSMLEVLHGVADFRVGPRGGGFNLERLPRPAFWEEFVCVEGVKLSERKLPADLDRWRHAFQVQYGNVVLVAARQCGRSVEEVMRWLLEGAAPSAGTFDNPIVGLIAGAVGGTLDGGS